MTPAQDSKGLAFKFVSPLKPQTDQKQMPVTNVVISQRTQRMVFGPPAQKDEEKKGKSDLEILFGET